MQPFFEATGQDPNESIWAKSWMDPYKIKDKYYGVAIAGGWNTLSTVIFYNKDLFEENGITTPRELWKSGNWNWDTFKKTALEISDLGDYYCGYAGRDSYSYLLSSGTDYVKFNGKTFVNNMDDPMFRKAWEFYSEMVSSGAQFKPDGSSNYPQLFLEGKFGMYGEGSYCMSNIGMLGDYAYNIDDVRGYVEYLQSNGCKPGYILTELSAIKWIHCRMNPKRNLPKSNRSFLVARRQLYKLDKSILKHEFDGLIKTALRMNRTDVVIEAYMDKYFGLRHEEFVTLRVHQIEYALKYKQLNLKNTKGGQERDIPVETKLQENILKRVLAFAKKNGKYSMDYVICDNHKDSVRKKKKSLENWMNNNKKNFVDPERTKYRKPGKRPRDTTIHWHSLRHSYYQETKARLKAEGRLTDSQIERELSECMGHHRNDVNNTYSDELVRIK